MTETCLHLQAESTQLVPTDRSSFRLRTPFEKPVRFIKLVVKNIISLEFLIADTIFPIQWTYLLLCIRNKIATRNLQLILEPISCLSFLYSISLSQSPRFSSLSVCNYLFKQRNSVAFSCKRSTPTERQPLVGEFYCKLLRREWSVALSARRNPHGR
jgi:hypothetical protein